MELFLMKVLASAAGAFLGTLVIFSPIIWMEYARRRGLRGDR